ncbi:hypothetical protein L1887_22792 [Cichorium endivia]|nr:hypothetical protein L1887_22792 [Cichorium endivia]
MEGMASVWNYQESIDELKFKIYMTELELEAVKAKANEEMNRNTESVKQLLQLLKLVRHERDETRDQIQKLLAKIMPYINNTMIPDCFLIDQVHQHHQKPFVKPAKANSSFSESNSLSDTYNHSTSPMIDPVYSPEFSNINTNTSFVQDYRQEVMLSSGFQAMGSVPKMDHATLILDSMIKGKTLPQKGNLFQAVMKAGPLLQTLLVENPPASCGSFSQMIVGGGSILSFDDCKL